MKQLTERIEQLGKENTAAGYTGTADCSMTHMMISEKTARVRGLVQ